MLSHATENAAPLLVFCSIADSWTVATLLDRSRKAICQTSFPCEISSALKSGAGSGEGMDCLSI